MLPERLNDISELPWQKHGQDTESNKSAWALAYLIFFQWHFSSVKVYINYSHLMEKNSTISRHINAYILSQSKLLAFVSSKLITWLAFLCALTLCKYESWSNVIIVSVESGHKQHLNSHCKQNTVTGTVKINLVLLFLSWTCKAHTIPTNDYIHSEVNKRTSSPGLMYSRKGRTPQQRVVIEMTLDTEQTAFQGVSTRSRQLDYRRFFFNISFIIFIIFCV